MASRTSRLIVSVADLSWRLSVIRVGISRTAMVFAVVATSPTARSAPTSVMMVMARMIRLTLGAILLSSLPFLSQARVFQYHIPRM